MNKNISKKLDKNNSERIIESQKNGKKISDFNEIIEHDNERIKQLKKNLANIDSDCGIYTNYGSCTATEN